MTHFPTGSHPSTVSSRAGAAFMLANGPVTVFRATSKIWEFTASALLLQAGLTAPRLAGLAVGGVTGCFAALALWYGLLAALLSRSAAPPAARPTPLLPLLRLARQIRDDD
jgi:hypothetical protein